MAWQERLRNVARNLAGATGEALVDYAEFDPLIKAEDPADKKQGAQDEGQDRTPGGTAEDTATNAPVPTEPATEDPKTLFWDPFAIVEQLGYKERPSALTYGTLNSMVQKMPIIQAIIQTRIQQVAAFCVPAKSRFDLGFRIRARETEKAPSKASLAWAKQMSTFLMRTGVTENPRGRNTFESFVRKIMRDSLVYDQYAFEIVPNRKGQPAEFYAVDASTIRLADSASTYLDEDLDQAIRYVQIYDGMVISEYTQEDLCFGVRNPRSDIRLFGYGTSEVEMLLTVITAMLYGWEYNVGMFRQGTAQKGLLNFKGAIPEKSLRQFRRHWYTMLSGVENAWRTPITNAEEIQWVNMQNSARDMEYAAWYDFQIKIACAVFTMDPVEVNFKYGNTGQKGGMTEANNKEKVTESKERGLRPLLRNVENAINQHIIWPISEDFEFAFVGLDAGTKDAVADLNTKLVKSTRMVDELRAEDDLPPLPDKKGQVILDPTWLQNAQSIDNPPPEPGEGGFPGADGQPGDGGDDEEVDFNTLMDKEFGGDGDDEDKEDDNKPAPPSRGSKKQSEAETTEKSMVVDLRI